jgi:hypothetical protein
MPPVSWLDAITTEGYNNVLSRRGREWIVCLPCVLSVEDPRSEMRSLRPIRIPALWLVFGPVAVLILLPILNVLFHIEEAMHPLLPPVILLVCLLLMFAGAFLAFAGVWGVWQERTTILEAGLPARALILSAEMGDAKMTQRGVDERWLVVLELEVQPADGPSFEARVEHFVPLLEIPRLQAGEVVDVKYDPQDRTRVAVV